jgi:hypothetical protein
VVDVYVRVAHGVHKFTRVHFANMGEHVRQNGI